MEDNNDKHMNTNPNTTDVTSGEESLLHPPACCSIDQSDLLKGLDMSNEFPLLNRADTSTPSDIRANHGHTLHGPNKGRFAFETIRLFGITARWKTLDVNAFPFRIIFSNPKLRNLFFCASKPFYKLGVFFFQVFRFFFEAGYYIPEKRDMRDHNLRSSPFNDEPIDEI